LKGAAGLQQATVEPVVADEECLSSGAAHVAGAERFSAAGASSNC